MDTVKRKGLDDKVAKIGAALSVVGLSILGVFGIYTILNYDKGQVRFKPETQQELVTQVDYNKDGIISNQELADWGDNNGIGYHPFESPMQEIRYVLKPYLPK